MTKLHRIPLFIISLLGIAVSVGVFSVFFEVRYISDIISDYWTYVPYVVAVYCGIVCLSFLVLLLIALFFPSKANNMLLIRDKGRLQFAKQTVESTVRYSYSDIEGISFSKVLVRLKRPPEKTKIYVKLSINDPNKILEMTETVQNRIETALLASLGVTVTSINVKVAELSMENKNEKAAEETHESRVI